jgi:hypothetical protein
MSPIKDESDKRGSGKLWLTIIYLILSVGPFVVGCLGYLSGDFNEYGLNILRGWDGLLLALLLGLPIIALVICMCALFWRARHDEDTALFHSFCLLLMSLTPCSYCALWCFYVYRVLDKHPALLSGIAFGLVLLIIIPVVYMTYLIMTTPESLSPALKVSDVKQRNWESFCGQLRKNMEAASEHGSTSLAGSFDDKVLKSHIEKGDLPDSRRPDVIRALNKLLPIRDLDQAEDLKKLVKPDKSHLHSEYDFQMYNRTLIDMAYSSTMKRTGWVEKLTWSVREWVDDENKRLKAGVTKSPFWAMVFFFTIFLGVTYLLGFAFAFHDKANLQTEKKPALFSPRSPLYGVGEYPLSSEEAATSSAPQQAGQPGQTGVGTWPEYVFYFDNYSAMPRYESSFNQDEFESWVKKKREHEQASTELNSKGKGELSSKRRDELVKQLLPSDELKKINDEMLLKHTEWKGWQNSEHLDHLVEAIVCEDDARHGQGLLIQVRGSADDKQVKPKETSGGSYPSNYALSEARAQAVTYALLERLAKKGRLHGGLQWVVLPLSNENPSIPLSSDEIKERKSNVNAQGDEISVAKREIDEIPNNTEEEKSAKTSLNKYLDAIKGLKGLDDEKVSQLISKLRLYKRLLLDGERPIDEERRSQTKNRQQVEAELKEIIEDFNYEHVDSDARKRVVVVTVKPVQQSLGHMFAPLSLMDYMYFTIYTITTTGYGDIVPTTTYAKFLCSAANILEVLFFVVFFNGLLSMRKSQEGLPGEGTEWTGAERRADKIKNVVQKEGASTNGNADLTGMGEFLKENKKTLEEVKKLLQHPKGLRRFWPF